MTALALTNTLTNGTNADASKVQQNFTDIVNYVNSHVMRDDGTVSMAAELLTNNADPTNVAGAVRKAYLDGAVAIASGGVSQAFTNGVWKTVLFLTETRDADNGANTATNYNLASGVFTVPKTGAYLIAGNWLNGITTNDLLTYNTRVHIAGGSAVDIQGPKDDPNAHANGVSPNGFFSLVWYCTVGQTIEPQIMINNNVTRTLGANFSVAWLHA